MNKNILRGMIHGKKIELAEDSGFVDGTEVEVHIVSAPQRKGSVEGLMRCAGILADEWTEEDDRILSEIQSARKQY